MTGELILAAAGVALMLGGLLKRGASGRGVRLAPLNRWPRIALVGVGVMCVVAGVILLATDDGPGGPATERITDALGSMQVSETIRVSIDGRPVGVLRVDARSPKDEIAVTVASAGRHDYETNATIQYKGKPVTRVRHSGVVVIDGESNLELFSNHEGQALVKPAE